MRKREQVVHEFYDYLDYQFSYFYVDAYDLIDDIKINLYFQLRDQLRSELRTNMWMYIKYGKHL